MNSNIQGNNSPTTDSESESKYESIVHRVEELEQRVDNQQETIEEQQSTIDDQQDEIDELRQELTGQQETIQNQQETIDNQQDEHVNQLHESFEGDSGGTAPTPTDGRTTIQKHELTPVEQISRADSENLDEVIDSPSVRRAVSLFKNIVDWGNRTPKGIVLKSSDNPLSLLSADMDNSLCWKQYYRAAEALESLSEGALTFFNDSRHGKMLVLHEHSDVYDRMMNGSLSVSSVGAEG
jgi:TolA-binding protein